MPEEDPWANAAALSSDPLHLLSGSTGHEDVDPWAALAGVVAAAFTTLLVVTDSVSGPGGSQSELLAPDAVTAARLQLAQAEQGDNLAKLDAAIAQGESVLKTIGVGAHARTQSLAQVRPADVDTWLEKAEAAGAKVEGFEAMRSRTRSEAARIKRAEEDWMKQAKEAKERAQQLAAHSSSSVECQRRNRNTRNDCAPVDWSAQVALSADMDWRTGTAHLRSIIVQV